ncbi:coiled-coil domain-containing protein 192 isoform X2 [Suricata suricatta]|uniref:Coiled-coil domain containing 192 n=1 Tax=Suricata suricatta TaxID=37032 RepID=A0A673TWU7_SURSU|nr:coiled-coil domain-containing protein 192 isoform X2 [Suricata suricatta]
MGKCYSKKSVALGYETPWRSSITSASSESNIQRRNKILKESQETGQKSFTLAQLEALEICLKEAEEKAKRLSEQLAASEGTKSKLLEQVFWLEKKLRALDHKEESGESYKKMVLAKNQYIEKLQAKVKASQEQLIAHFPYFRCVCQVKHLCERDLSNRSHRGSDAKMMEIIRMCYKDKLTFLNLQSLKVISEDSPQEESCGGLPPVEEGDQKVNLIMELSKQVSLQNEKITQLEEILEKKEKKIQQLEAEQGSHPF